MADERTLHIHAGDDGDTLRQSVDEMAVEVDLTVESVLAEDDAPLLSVLQQVADDAAFYDIDDAVDDEIKFRKIYDIQHWRDSTSRYLDDTTDGFLPDQPPLTQEQLRTLPSATYHGIVGAMAAGLAGERIAFECSAALCAHAPDDHARSFLATQVIDEARHVEVFTKRLRNLGIEDMDGCLQRYVNPRIFKFHAQLRERVVESRDFIGGVVGQNLALEGLALGFFEFNAGLLQDIDPGTSKILEGVLLDERRHVGFGLVRLRELCDKDATHRHYVHDTVGELSDEMMEIFEENADNMARLGVDPAAPMERVRHYHDSHLRRLGMALD